ncbi:MAG: D-glycero-beta-D-manno-heptose 1-phosphate adenylyltransferase [Candidatus Kapaibacteriota bacterium]|jgi:rfaE bifunctional protein nucleotidyltransferase chain/domain
MLLDISTLKQVSYELQQSGNKIVFTNGCFDILHSGHVTYLNESKKQGDYLVVGLNSDNSVKRLKGESRPINNENDRAIVLSGLKSVDFVCIFDEETPKDMIEAISPNVLTKGGDYIIENIVGADFVINNGGKVVVINFVEGKSTTNIINKAKL